VPEAGLEPARLAAADFESATSTNSITRATLFITGKGRLIAARPRRAALSLIYERQANFSRARRRRVSAASAP
jgi:hypothetical protein